MPAHVLRQARGQFEGSVLTLATETDAVYQRLEKALPDLRRMAAEYFAGPVDVWLEAPQRVHKTEAMLKEEFAARDELKPCLEILDATVSRVRPLDS